jgi:hypothetical protein
VFNRQDGRSLPQPGMIRLEAMDAEVDAFAASSSVRTTIERVE